jgi:hypothetical protein
MPPKRTIRGSGDAGAGEAPTQRVKLGTEVAVAADEVSRGQHHDLDFVGAVVPPPQPEREVNSNSGNDYDSDGKLVSHQYTHLCSKHIMCFLWLLNPSLIFLEYKSYGYVLSVHEIRVIKIR